MEKTERMRLERDLDRLVQCFEEFVDACMGTSGADSRPVARVKLREAMRETLSKLAVRTSEGAPE